MVVKKKLVKKTSTRKASPKVLTALDFSKLLRDGLSSVKSYVVLKQKNRSPVYLAFKPLVNRINTTTVYVGGKLSAFPNDQHEGWSGIDAESKLNILKKAFKALPQDRVGEARIGSHAGVFISGAHGDLKTLGTKIETKKVVKTILDGIEKELDIKIENRVDVTKYLVMQFSQYLPGVFSPYHADVKMAPRQIGKVSAVQFGQSKASSYGNPAVEQFVQKHHLTFKHAQAA